MPADAAQTRGFADRRSAGENLARALKRVQLPSDPVVLGLPRGGVPVAFEIARALHVPLHVLIVRKIAMPVQPELAIGAIASGGIVVREAGLEDRLRLAGISFDELVQDELRELERREHVYQAGTPPVDLVERTALIVDDGVATGATMLAAIRSARKAGAGRILAVAPVASEEAAAIVGREADQSLFLKVPPSLTSIGDWYDDFPQLTDDEVCGLLGQAPQHAEEIVR